MENQKGFKRKFYFRCTVYMVLLASEPLPGWMGPASLILNQQDKICLVLHLQFQLRGFTNSQAWWRARTSWGTHRNLICSMHRPHLRNQNSPDSRQQSLPAWGGRICSCEKQCWQNGKAMRACHELLKNYKSLGIPHQKSPEIQTLSKFKRLWERFLFQPGPFETHWK